MPRRTTAARKPPRQRKPGPVGPYDLSAPYRLPGGTELDALAKGYAMEKANKNNRKSYDLGFYDAASIANKNLVKDTANAYIVGDTSLGGPVRGLTLAQLRNDYGNQIKIFGPESTDSVARKAIASMTGMKGRSVNNPPPYMDTTYEIGPGIYISQTKTALALQPSEKKGSTAITQALPTGDWFESLINELSPNK